MNDELKNFIIEAIQEEITPCPVEIPQRWEGGRILLEPDNDTQSKEIPIEVFFRKLITVRDSLRVLEQKINSNNQISQTDKVNLHAYITKAYGSLTTFNILFQEGKDKFVGAGKGSGGGPSKDKMTLSDAKKKLGLNEY